MPVTITIAMPKPAASWISRFARRLLEVQPELRPLDAVRSASQAFADSAQMPPEEAASSWVAIHTTLPAGSRIPPTWPP